MNWLERLIKQKLEDTREIILRGDAKDYAAYASAVARHIVLKELVEEIIDRHAQEAKGEIVDDE